jgi:hypothetical protein
MRMRDKFGDGSRIIPWEIKWDKFRMLFVPGKSL